MNKRAFQIDIGRSPEGWHAGLISKLMQLSQAVLTYDRGIPTASSLWGSKPVVYNAKLRRG